MLPDVDQEDRAEALGKRRVLIGGGNDLEPAVGVHDQPGPARAESAQGGLFEFRLELGERAEFPVDGRGKGAHRLPLAIGFHQLKKEIMIIHASGIIMDCGPDILGQNIGIVDQIFSDCSSDKPDIYSAPG